MYNIVICDDDNNYSGYMKKMLLKAGLEQEEVTIAQYGSGEEMIEAVKSYERVDLLLLDMEMKKLNGNETAKLFRKKFPSSLLVFCSGSCLPTVESFETTPFRYLLKEYTEEKMLQELEVIIREIKKQQIEPDVAGMWKSSTVKLGLKEILYISIERRGSLIYVNPKIEKYKTDNIVKSSRKVAEWYELLEEYGFAYAHNSYIVNLSHIKRMAKEELELSDGTVLSVARSKEKELKRLFVKNIARKY